MDIEIKYTYRFLLSDYAFNQNEMIGIKHYTDICVKDRVEIYKNSGMLQYTFTLIAKYLK